MGQYTDYLEKKILEISPIDEDYIEQLLEVASLFRDFDVALDDFMLRHGFDGNIDSIDEKVAFIKSKFYEAGIVSLPRNLRKWFTEKKRIEKRQIAFQFCFAFHLNLEESEEFFRTVCLFRGFDCHYIEEAIYYYAISHHLSYQEALEMIEKAPKDPKGKVDFNTEVLFTESIIQEIHRMKSKEELIQYFYENLDQFTYNNATAYQYIQKIWHVIEDDLASRENQQLFGYLKGVKRRKNRSVWDVYLQILGLYDFDDDESPLFVLNTNRSLKPMLKNNCLIHPLAEDSFPDRQGLEAILRGEHKSHELVRKTLILLVFYKYWVTLFLKRGEVSREDKERCYAQMNRYLVDANYPSLYAGNPYDWIFMFALNDDDPLGTFRYFMRELYMEKEDELQQLKNHSFKVVM